MNILFVTLRPLEINSSVTISNIGLLKGLIQLGCNVDLLMPHANNKLIQYDPIDKRLYDAINVMRIGGSEQLDQLLVDSQQNKLTKYVVKIMRGFFYKFSLYDSSIRYLKYTKDIILNKKYDLVISTSDPKTSHLFVRKLIQKGLNYKVWLQHWGDPLSLDITNKTVYPVMYLRHKENQILSWADYVVYASPLTKEAQTKALPKVKDKLHFVPLPYDSEKLYGTTNNSKITIGYFGDYNSNVRNILPLYEFCKKNTNLQLIIAGQSNLLLESQENIQIFPRLKQDMISELEAKCDILVCICNKRGTQIPGKVYYYSSTDKPILVILDGEYKTQIYEYFAKYGRYYFCENNVEHIGKTIDEITHIKKEYKPCLEFSPVQIAKQILDVIM